MRTLGFFILLLLLLPTGPAGEKPDQYTKKETPLATNTKKINDIDTGKLKQSNWYAEAIKSIEESEYEIKSTDKTNEFSSPNRQQNLSASYTADKFILEPGEKDNWKLELTFNGIYSGKKKIYTPHQSAIAVTNKSKIQFNHSNEFTIEYINSKEGVRQNFIIEKEPASKPEQLTVKLQTNQGWDIQNVHSKEIHFAKLYHGKTEKKLTYNDLKVWDANHKELDASFSVIKDEILIHVKTTDAVYPVTIDPISTTPDWSTQSNSVSANMGWTVSTAGDVNGDGYSDVLIGAPNYNNMGRVFAYYGSSTGLPVTPNKTYFGSTIGDQFGYCVSTAGDVNGDGYDDIIIGVPFDESPETDEGKAFVFHGSSSGLLTTAAWTAESNQAGAEFGTVVAGAGDVNGNGYSDVIVGAHLYDNGSGDEGRVFAYHGSASGLSLTAAWTAESNQAGAKMGNSLACAGDVNTDGYSDVIIGAFQYDNGETDEGRAYVYHGSVSGLSIVAAWTAEPNLATSLFGIGVSGAGDVNGDGYSDVVVGASRYTNGETDEGAAFAYFGSATGLTTASQWTVEGSLVNARFGFAVASAGDVNNDGFSDVIVGANEYTSGQTAEGTAFVYHGAPDVILPVKFISFTTTKDGSSARLKWITTNEDPGAKFEVQHSADGISFAALVVIHGNNQGYNEYEWVHVNPGKGKNFYRIKAIEDNKITFTATRLLNFENNAVTSIYPNPAFVSQPVIIKNENIKKDNTTSVSFLNMAGQTIWQVQIMAATGGTLPLTIPDIPGGIYILQIETGQYIGKVKVAIARR